MSMPESIVNITELLGKSIPTALAVICISLALTFGTYKEKIARIEAENASMHSSIDKLSIAFYELRDEIHQLKEEVKDRKN